MDAENMESDFTMRFLLEDLVEEVAKTAKAEDKICVVKFPEKPVAVDQESMIKDDNFTSSIPCPSSTEVNDKFEPMNLSFKLKFSAKTQAADQKDLVKDENCTLEDISRPSSNEENVKLEYKSCRVKFSAKAHATDQGDVAESENSILNDISYPSSVKKNFADIKIDNADNSVIRNEDSLRFELREFARNCLAFMAGFCVGLVYGIFNSYTDASMSDLYVSIYFVIYLILYLVFF